jgi:hypothetical protein
LNRLPILLAAVAEGAWVAAVYAIVCAMAKVPAPLGVAGLALAALAGLVVARRFGQSFGDRWPAVALGLVVGTSILGALASPAAIAALLALDPVGAARAHPGGVLAGLALLRGMAHGRASASAVSLGHLVEVGLPGLVIPVVVAGMLDEPWRGEALAGIAAAVVTFLVAATLGVAVARIDSLGTRAGFDWRRNRAWLALVALLAIGVVAVVLPVASFVGPVVRIVVGAIVVPLFAVGVIAGLTQVSRRALASVFVLGVVMLLVVALAGPARPTEGEGEPPGPGGILESESQVVTFAAGGLLTIAVIAGIVVLARLWMREALRIVPGDVAEERTIDRTGSADHQRGRSLASLGRPAAAGPPADAATAYLALLADIAARPAVARAAAESPAEHARRLRTAGVGAAGLDLLAADYELARFAERRLTAAESRRAIDRWRRLRRTLGG